MIRVEPIQYNRQWYIVPINVVDDFYYYANLGTLDIFEKRFGKLRTVGGLETAELWAKDTCLHENYKT